MNRIYIFIAILLCSINISIAQPLVKVTPEEVGLDNNQLRSADNIIQLAIDKKEIPGAVLAVVRHGKMAYLKAFGNRQIYPTVEPMHVNTFFDMSYCTKQHATAI